MKRISLIILGLSVIASAHAEGIRDEYLKRYDFITMKDTIFTFASEFTLPDGFEYPYNGDLNEFQVWLRDFPLWHQWKAVGRLRGGKAFEAKEIARPVHIPWDGQRYTDRAFMVRILGEWYRFRSVESQMSWIPRQGAAVGYEQWLKSKPIYTARGELALKDDTPRESSDYDFYSYLHFMIDDGNYRSLANNCDTISLDELSVGDLLIGHDRTGKNGKTYIVMSLAVDKDGDKRFILGTGCDEACDFYIPCFDKQRNAPWLTLTEVHKLLGDYENNGYYRFRDIPN